MWGMERGVNIGVYFRCMKWGVYGGDVQYNVERGVEEM